MKVPDKKVIELLEQFQKLHDRIPEYPFRLKRSNVTKDIVAFWIGLLKEEGMYTGTTGVWGEIMKTCNIAWKELHEQLNKSEN